MISLVSSLRGYAAGMLRDRRGAVAIETALVAPVLILMSVGSYEISDMVARQHELQSGASEATSVALAANQGAQTDTVQLAALLRESLNLNENQVTVTKMYRCDARDYYVTDKISCESNGSDKKRYSTYVKIQLRDTYTPTWSKIGISQPFTYRVDRTIQLS